MEDVVDQEETLQEVKLPNWSKCSVCADLTTNEDVMFLPCLHVVCSQKCLTSIIINDSKNVNYVRCTMCDKKHSTTDAFPSAFLQELLERERLTEEAKSNALVNPTCTYCVRGDDAVSWCEQCSDHLCVSCKEHHGFATKTRDHTLTDVSEKKSELPDLKQTSYTICQLHSRQLTQFCTSCISTVCDMCATNRHIGHAMEPVKELADQTRTSIRKSLKQISSLMPKFQEIENILLHKAKHMLETQKKFLINEASAQLTRLLSALMKREMEQRKELTETVVHKVKELNLKRLKISSLLKQSQQFFDIANDLLTEASDWAIITNRQNYEAQLFNIMDTAEQFDEQSKIDTYIEKGFNFLMDKSVGHQAEKHINLLAKITYSFNPKAPTEIKIIGSAVTNKTYSRNIPKNIVPVRPPLGSKASNGSQQQLQTRPNNKPNPVKVEGMAHHTSSEKPSNVSNTMANQRKLGNAIKSEKESNLAKTSMGNESSNVVEQYASLNDQLIIEPVDDDSEGMEEDMEVDGEQRLQEDNMTDILDDADYDVGMSDDELDFSRKNVSKQSPSKQGKPMQRFGKKMEEFVGGSQTEDTDQGETMSENNGNNSASEDESQNDAPDLSPESMKSPPKLQKASATRSVKPHPTDYENPSDAPPPILHPSVNLLEHDGETPDLEPQIAAKSKRTQGKDDESSNPTESDSQESGTSRRSTRSRKVSGRHNRNESPAPRKQGPSTRRRGSVSLDCPLDDRSRSDSRSSPRLRFGTTSDLPSKRERKKKTDPEFVQEIVKKRAKSEKVSPVHATTTPSTDGRRGRKPGRGRKRHTFGGRKPNLVGPEVEDDISNEVAAEVLDFPLVKEDKMKIGDDADGNEDYCAVCKDGGDGDLLCCDLCPKVFHLKCHLPAIDQIPEGDWQCFFCKPRDEIFNDPETEGDKSCPEDSIQFRSRKEYLTACKFMCEVYMIPESVVTRSYFEKMSRLGKMGAGGPIYSLPSIRTRLTLMKPKPYTYFSELLDDMNTMFKQATDFYLDTSDEYKFTKTFEAKFTALHEYYLPQIETFAKPIPNELID